MSIDVMSVEDFNALTLPDIPSIMGDGLVVPEGRVILYAAPGTYKSFAMMQFCYALAQGVDWLGYPVHKACKTMYLQTELIANQVQKRSRRMSSYYGDTGVMLGNIRDFRLRTEDDWGALYDVVKDNEIEYVVLDPLAAVMYGSEVDEQAIQVFTDAIDHLCTSAHTGVVLIHHGRKAGHNDKGSKISSGQDDLRGHSRLSGWPDTIMKLERDKKNKIELQIQKIRNGPDETSRWLIFDSEYGILRVSEEDPFVLLSQFLKDGPKRNQDCIQFMQESLGWAGMTFARHRTKWITLNKIEYYRDPTHRSYHLVALKEEV